MEKANDLKAIYVIVNASFADDVVDMTRRAGASGATIINARGAGPVQQEIFGISIDAEKEMVLCIADGEVAERIIAAVKEKAGSNSPANGFCFIMPVERAPSVSKPLPQARQGK
mgnify:FL=1